MIFKNIELESLFDIESNQQYSTLDDLACEIDVMNHLLLSFKEERKKVELINGKVVDLNNVKEETWLRDKNSIKELLYRENTNKYSISARLEELGITCTLDYTYLKLLYLFYMLNYYIYPSYSIFVELKKNTYINLLDDGLYEDILSIILNNSKYLHAYINMHVRYNTLFDALYQGTEVEFDEDDGDAFVSLLHYIFKKHISTYCQDCLMHLSHIERSSLEIPPPESWKRRYVDNADIFAFLKEDETIGFIKQETKHYEVREKIKFVESKAVRFVLDLLDYDLDWIGDSPYYALKLSVSIKVFEDYRKRKYKFHHASFSRLLNPRNINEGFSCNLYIHFFILLCHIEYLKAINKDIDGFIVKEMSFFENVLQIISN